MATVPTTIVIFTEDKVHFPMKHVVVVMKELFQYGVKEMSVKGDKLFISLSYSPRSATLRRKFGNLPVRYMRTKLEKEEDFRILEKVVRKFKFNLLDEQLEDVERQQQQTLRIDAASPSSSSQHKRVCYNNREPIVLDEDYDEIEQFFELPSTLTSSSSSGAAATQKGKRKRSPPSPQTTPHSPVINENDDSGVFSQI